jgi:hypothetical protein
MGRRPILVLIRQEAELKPPVQLLPSGFPGVSFCGGFAFPFSLRFEILGSHIRVILPSVQRNALSRGERLQFSRCADQDLLNSM